MGHHRNGQDLAISESYRGQMAGSYCEITKVQTQNQIGTSNSSLYFVLSCGSLSSCPIYTKILGLRPLSGIFCGLFKRPQKDTHMISICKKPLLASYETKFENLPCIFRESFFSFCSLVTLEKWPLISLLRVSKCTLKSPQKCLVAIV